MSVQISPDASQAPPQLKDSAHTTLRLALGVTWPSSTASSDSVPQERSRKRCAPGLRRISSFGRHGLWSQLTARRGFRESSVVSVVGLSAHRKAEVVMFLPLLVGSSGHAKTMVEPWRLRLGLLRKLKKHCTACGPKLRAGGREPEGTGRKLDVFKAALAGALRL